jgi:transcriptional regulator PpsR
VKPFSAPSEHFGELDSSAAAMLVAVASDVTLVVSDSHRGVIRDMAFGNDDTAREMDRRWLGKPWIDSVTSESRAKVEALLKDAADASPPRWRHINHRATKGGELPMLYTAVRMGSGGRVLAFGRSLRPIAELQQQLVEAQQAMDREYLRLRQVETRHRLLFQVSAEAVLIVDASTLKVVEANPAAAKLLGEVGRKIIGRGVIELFEAGSRASTDSLLATVLATGRTQETPVRLAGDSSRQYLLSAALFREGRGMFHLLRMGRADRTLEPASGGQSRVFEVVESSPDGLIVTNFEGQIQYANRAFLDAAQLATAELVRDQKLDRWLGRPGIDFTLMANQLREHGSLRGYATTLQGDLGSRIDVEICGVSVPDGEMPCFGFTLREVGSKVVVEKVAAREKPRSVAQLTDMVGRMPLKELVRESTDMIERLCIETALQMTGDNRASAAEVLGLSRQSLYAKLRRHGLGDLTAVEADEAAEED